MNIFFDLQGNKLFYSYFYFLHQPVCLKTYNHNGILLNSITSQNMNSVEHTGCLFYVNIETSSLKGNDAHLRAIIQSEKKMETSIFQTLKGSLLCGPWSDLSNSSKLLCMSSLPVSMERIPSRTTEKKGQHCFSNYNTICCHGNQWSDLAEFRTHPSFYACPHCLQV